jgi:hypothetical protein
MALHSVTSHIHGTTPDKLSVEVHEEPNYYVIRIVLGDHNVVFFPENLGDKADTLKSILVGLRPVLDLLPEEAK